MKAVKILVSVLVALVVVIAIALFIGVRNLDTLVEMAIESVGPQVTKTDVLVDEVNIELGEGTGRIVGLSVANPEGYSPEPIFTVGEVGLDIEPASLTEPVVVLEAVVVEQAVLNAEHKGVADINVQDMLNNIQPNGAEEAEPTTASPDVRFMVERLSINGATLNLQSEKLGERQLKMDDITLRNLGDREKGLTPAQLTRAILDPLLEQASQKLEEEVKGEASERLQQELEERIPEEDREKLESLLGR